MSFRRSNARYSGLCDSNMILRLASLTAILLFAGCASGGMGAAVSNTRPETNTEVELKPEVISAGPVVEATTLKSAPDAWQLLDLAVDGVPGVSANLAYEELLADRTAARAVVVAVIDGGIDTTHVDLRENLWVNEDELPGNGVDDDNNGYVDDVYGWNFLGGPDGKSVDHETLEVTRLHADCLSGEVSPIKKTCQDIAADYEAETDEVNQTLDILDQIEEAYAFALPVLRGAGAGQNPTK